MDTPTRERREAVIRRHMESENRQDWDATFETQAHPHYELVGTGQVFDGRDDVLSYYVASRQAFPDQSNEIHAMHFADDAVIVEFDLMGTHTGEFLGVAGTGRSHRTRMIAVFEFDDADLIVCERIYFDTSTLLRQLDLA
jgi:steroid delta-isomerase-like uncharacterized protein